MFTVKSYDVHVGLFEGNADVRACISKIGGQIESFDTDIRDQISWEDPDYLQKCKDGTHPDLSVIPEDVIRAYQHPDVELVRKNTIGKSKEQITKERDFYGAWESWYLSWHKWKREYETAWINILSSNRFRECEAYGEELKSWKKQSSELVAMKPSAPNLSEPQGALPGLLTGPTGLLSPTGSLGSLPWTWIAIGGVLIGGAILLNYVKVLLPTPPNPTQ